MVTIQKYYIFALLMILAPSILSYGIKQSISAHKEFEAINTEREIRAISNSILNQKNIDLAKKIARMKVEPFSHLNSRDYSIKLQNEITAQLNRLLKRESVKNPNFSKIHKDFNAEYLALTRGPNYRPRPE